MVITNASVVDVREDTTTPNLTFIIRHGRIQAVAKIGMISSDQQTRMFNANGKYLIPGLWDMHVDSAGGRAASWQANSIPSLYIVNGITGIRDMGDELASVPLRKRAIDQGSLLGPHVVIAGS